MICHVNANTPARAGVGEVRSGMPVPCANAQMTVRAVDLAFKAHLQLWPRSLFPAPGCNPCCNHRAACLHLPTSILFLSQKNSAPSCRFVHRGSQRARVRGADWLSSGSAVVTFQPGGDLFPPQVFWKGVFLLTRLRSKLGRSGFMDYGSRALMNYG